jgi:predicted amidohydrolase
VRFAEPAGGPTETRLRKLAESLGIWLVPGSSYERDGDKIYNTSVVIDPGGNIVARYRKVFPWAPWEAGISPGTEHTVWDIPGVGRFGISICYDSWFPETTRAMAWSGAEVIIHPTATATVDRPVELVLARSHAATNQCYWVEVNSAGPLAVGQSIVVGPEGDVVHQAGNGREVITAQLDLAKVRRVRSHGSFGLNQVLKTLRDSSASFPQYENRTIAASGPWDQLGGLTSYPGSSPEPSSPAIPANGPNAAGQIVGSVGE